MQIQRNIINEVEIYDMRHYEKIEIRKKKANGRKTVLFYYKNGTRIDEECIEIAVSEEGHYYQVIPCTYTDLLRLQRVIRRGLKRLKRNENNS